MNHDPDPDFVSHLRWQVAAAVRRTERFAMPVTRPMLRWARTAALVTVSLLFGAGAVLAADALQDSRQRDYHLARARIQLEMARLELEYARRAQEETDRLMQTGLIGTEEQLESKLHLQEAEYHVRKRQLEVQEIAITGTEPRRDLAALRIDGRDFVTESIRLDLERIRAHVEGVQARYDRGKALHEQGVVMALELTQLQGEVAESRVQVEWVERTVELRAAFLSGKISGI